MKLKAKEFTTLEKLPAGSLFLYGNTVCLKTEYRSNGVIDAYIVGSGEYFVGGEPDGNKRGKLVVLRLKVG